MYNAKVPSINKKFLCIVNRENTEFAAILSSYLAAEGEYLSVFEFPFVSAPKPEDIEFADPLDIHAVSRQRAIELAAYINNVQARIGVFENILLVGLNEEQKSYLNFVDGSNIIDLETTEQIYFQLDPFLSSAREKLRCRSQDLLYGLSKAIKTKCVLLVDENAPEIDHVFSGSEGVIIVENVNDASGNIAVNYAIAIGADIFIVNSIDDATRKHIPIEIQNWKNGDNDAYNVLNELVTTRLSGLELGKFKFATIFTDGLPYSVIIGNPIPITYVNMQMRPDHFIINSIIAENVKHFGGAVIFSPENFDKEEVNDLGKNFESKNIYVKKILGEDATSRNLSKSIEFFPYDIYHIVSHGGQITGTNIEQIFTDLEGKEHSVVYDFILGLAPGGTKGKIETTMIVHPRKINGLDFHSEERKQKDYPHELFTTMYKAIFDHPKDKITILKKNNVIADSAAISCSDFNFHGIIQYLAGEGIPFVFNNTCFSGGKMAEAFLSIGCRGYIGTCWNIDNSVAVECATSFYQHGFSMPICQAQFIAAKNAEGSNSENIYVYWGLHFSTLQAGNSAEESRGNVYQNLEKGKEIWTRKLKEKLTDNQKLTVEDAVVWLSDEIKSNFNENNFKALMAKFLGQLKS